MNKKIKNFVHRNKTTIVAVAATAIPLIVVNVKFFQANRAWAARNGCHDHNNHLHFTDEVFKRVVNGAKWCFDFDDKKVDSEGILVMTNETYAKEWQMAKDFLKKHELLEEFYKRDVKPVGSYKNS